MDVAHELAAAGAGEGTLVWAARQEQGRGRLGRTWASPEGGLYLSLIVRPARPLAEFPQLSLVAGLSAAEAIRELTGLSAAIRWPNDLLINDKKVAGILAEGSGLRAVGTNRPPEPRAPPARLSRSPGRASPEPVIVIGIGINVTTQLKDLPDTATSLLANLSSHLTFSAILPGGPANLVGGDIQHLTCALTGALCRHLEAWYDAWTTGGFAPIREALRPWMGHFGQPVHISAGSTRFEGTATDLDEQGRLVVRLDSGVQRAFEVGEVTLLH